MKKALVLLPLAFSLMSCAKLNNLINLPDQIGGLNTTMNGMDKKIGSMDDKMTDTNSALGTTNDAIHKQTLMVALQNLNDKKNWDELQPVPFKLMPYGQAFAQEATPLEIMNLFYLELQEINNAKLQLSPDPTTQGPYIQGTPEFGAILQEKMAKAAILEIIAGFTPQSITEAIVNSQIHGDGTDASQNFRSTAYAFLALRASFIHDDLLMATTLAQPLSNAGIIQQAIDYTQQVDYIDSLPYVSQLQATMNPIIATTDKAGDPVTAMPIPMSVSVNSGQALSLWQQIQAGINRDFKIDQGTVGISSADNQAISASETAAVTAAKATVAAAIQTWTTRNAAAAPAAPAAH
jgi:hypothetical protein